MVANSISDIGFIFLCSLLVRHFDLVSPIFRSICWTTMSQNKPGAGWANKSPLVILGGLTGRRPAAGCRADWADGGWTFRSATSISKMGGQDFFFNFKVKKVADIKILRKKKNHCSDPIQQSYYAYFKPLCSPDSSAKALFDLHSSTFLRLPALT